MVMKLGKNQPHCTLKGRDAIEGSGGKWAARNLLKFDEGKC